jgi:hypothetical protein
MKSAVRLSILFPKYFALEMKWVLHIKLRRDTFPYFVFRGQYFFDHILMPDDFDALMHKSYSNGKRQNKVVPSEITERNRFADFLDMSCDPFITISKKVSFIV